MWAWTTLVALAALAASPAPREMRVEEKGAFRLESELLVVAADSLAPESSTLLAPLQDAAGPLRIVRASEESKFPDGLYIGTAADPGGLGKRRLKKYLDGVETFGPEEYRLVVEKNAIVLAAGGVRGVWYGIQTLSGLIRDQGRALPFQNIRDWPTLGVRGVYLTNLPAEHELRAYAALKCTHLFLDSDDFYDLGGIRADAWRQVFDSARKNFLEPVPVFSTLHGMEHFLRGRPMLIEGRAVEEPVTLRDVEWASLRYPNILAENPEDVAVTISGVPCVHGQDYWADPAPLAAPFLPQGPRWRLRRELEGAIPNGAVVTARYAFATDDSGTLCFADPEARAWLKESLGRLVAELRPRMIHLDHGAIGRLNKDLRSQASGRTDAAFFEWTLEVLADTLKNIDPEIQLMMWADLLNSLQGARTYGLQDAAAHLPDSIMRVGRVQVSGPREAVERFEQLQPVVSDPFIARLEGPTGATSAFLQMMVEYQAVEGGIIVPASTPDSVSPALAAAWHGLGDQSIWTRRFNRYFNVALGVPNFPTVRGALAAHLNGATLRGEDPRDVNRRFETYCGQHLDVLHQDEAGYQLVRNMLALMTEYLALEARFSEDSNEAGLRRLRALVTEWQALDPAAEGERYQRILDTITTQQLFVPATILFQEDLRYYREDRPPYPQYLIPLRPEYQDGQGEASARLTLGAGQAIVRRIDFESVRLDDVKVEGRTGAEPWALMKRWTDESLAGVRGPLLLPDAAACNEMRVLARNADGAVLRDLRFYGAKPPAEMDVTYAVQAPAMRPDVEDRAWSRTPQAGAFLRTDSEHFAEAPTAVRVCRTRGDLYVGIEATDPRPETMVADFAQRDAPLWQQESVEIWLQPQGRLPLRLIVSPLGTQYDSEANDGGWDGPWEAVAQQTDTGWRTVVRIPGELLGETPRGSSLPFNVIRNRHSVESERSAWAHGYGAQPDLQWGALRFP